MYGQAVHLRDDRARSERSVQSLFFRTARQLIDLMRLSPAPFLGPTGCGDRTQSKSWQEDLLHVGSQGRDSSKFVAGEDSHEQCAGMVGASCSRKKFL